jgi:hypothetical protein
VIVVLIIVSPAVAVIVVRYPGTINATIHVAFSGMSGTATVNVSVDGNIISDQHISTNGITSTSYTYPVQYDVSSFECSVQNVTAKISGGGLITQSDSENPSVCPFSSVSIDLYV